MLSPHIVRRIALMIDADNISPKAFPDILAKAEKKGKVIYIFASGKESNLRGWREVIETYRLRIITAFVGKDVADRIIVKECADISLERPEIDSICIVSNDAGFAPICHLLRSWGMYVFVIGTAQAAKALQKDFNFEPLESLPSISPQTKKLMKLLYQVFTELNQEWLPLARIGETILKFDASFKAKDYGNTKLSKVLETMPEFIELKRDNQIYSARLKNQKRITNHQ